jgi:hypothetical protein
MYIMWTRHLPGHTYHLHDSYPAESFPYTVLHQTVAPLEHILHADADTEERVVGDELNLVL